MLRWYRSADHGVSVLAMHFPLVGNGTLLITVIIVLILIFGNLRGLREAGSYFAFPTYFYVVMLSATIILGYYKKIVGTLHKIPQPATHLLVDGRLGHQGNGLLMGLAFLTLLRAYANGGSSLTGLEAISNGVASFRRPESHNARSTLVVMSSVLAFLLIGTTLSHTGPTRCPSKPALRRSLAKRCLTSSARAGQDTPSSTWCRSRRS